MQDAHAVRTGQLHRFTWILIALLAATGASGCTMLQGVNDYLAYNDPCNDFVLGWRNTVWARQAWHERKGMFVDQPQFGSFGAGFRSGYVSVASGGDGCPPAVPPREYWTWKYQSPEGQAQVAAWFAGFPYGAAAAQEDGAGLYQQIQVSHAIERQYTPEFQQGVQGAEGTYGTPGMAPIINEPIRTPLPLENLPLADPQAAAARERGPFAEAGVTRTSMRPGWTVPAQGPVVPATHLELEQRAAALPATSSAPAAQLNPIPELRASSWTVAR